MKNGQNIDVSLDDGILILKDDLNFILNGIDNPQPSSAKTERQNQVSRRAVALKRRKQKLPGKAILAYTATTLSSFLLFYR